MDALLRPLPPQYGTQVRVVFKNFPLLQIHPWAMPGALLGRCIYKRYGEAAFWNYDVWAFGNQPQLNPQDFRQKALDWAKQSKMDSAQLGACMDQPETKAAVDHDIAEAQSLGVSGTPTLFINGRRSVGNLTLPQLKQIVDAELSYAQGKR